MQDGKTAAGAPRGNGIPDKRVHPDCTIDTLGLLCPLPVIRAAAKMKTMQAGEVLEVLSDDRGVEQDFPAWCRSHREDFLGLVARKGEFRIFLRKRSVTL